MFVKLKKNFSKILIINLLVVISYIASLFYLNLSEKNLEFLGIINTLFFLNFISLIIMPMIYFISKFYSEIKIGVLKVLSIGSCLLVILCICFYAFLKAPFWMCPEYPAIRGGHLIIEKIEGQWMHDKYVYFYKPSHVLFKKKLFIDPEPYSNFVPPSEAEIINKFNEV